MSARCPHCKRWFETAAKRNDHSLPCGRGYAVLDVLRGHIWVSCNDARTEPMSRLYGIPADAKVKLCRDLRNAPVTCGVVIYEDGEGVLQDFYINLDQLFNEYTKQNSAGWYLRKATKAEIAAFVSKHKAKMETALYDIERISE